MDEFQPTIESLSRYETPEWYKDLKFGIYCHWGLQSVPFDGPVDGWYARNMYIQGSWAYRRHVKKYGHPSEFGLKDFIPMWKAEKFDPDEICRIFKEAGAQYFTPVAIHHDNFDLWDSTHHKWNSVNMGPKKDIIGMFKKAALKHGLRFGVTTHLSRTYSWLQPAHHSDKKGRKKGVPYDGANPEFKDFYLDSSEDDNYAAPKNPPLSWRQHWIARMKDLIDKYHPEFFYFDAALPFLGEDQGQSGMEVLSHYYNDNLKQSNGKSHGMLTFKTIPEHGMDVSGISTIDHEVKFPDQFVQDYWQTDTTIEIGWFRNKYLPKKPWKMVISELVKVVAYNGNMLLNVGPNPDGSLDGKTTEILGKIGKWMKKNGEGIYGTRPWKSPREGNVFFTSKNEKIYSFIKNPRKRKLTLKQLGFAKLGRKIQQVKGISTGKTIEFDIGDDSIQLYLPIETQKEFFPCLEFS